MYPCRRPDAEARNHSKHYLGLESRPSVSGTRNKAWQQCEKVKLRFTITHLITCPRWIIEDCFDMISHFQSSFDHFSPKCDSDQSIVASLALSSPFRLRLHSSESIQSVYGPLITFVPNETNFSLSPTDCRGRVHFSLPSDHSCCYTQ